MKSKSIMQKVLLRLKHYLPLVLLSLLLALATVAATLYIPILIGNAIDFIVGPGNVDIAAVTSLLVRAAIMAGAVFVLQWLMNTVNNRIAYHMVRNLRNEAFAKIHSLPLSYIDAHDTGDIVSRIVTDADQFCDGLLLGFTQLFTGIVTIIGTLAFMFSLNPAITLAVIVLTPISLLVARFIARCTYAMFTEQSVVRGEQTAFVEEMLANQKVVVAFSHQPQAQQAFDGINDRLETSTRRATFFSSLTNPSTRFINALVYAAVALFGALSAMDGGITVGGLVCFLSYANQYTKPFNEISGVITELQNAMACAQRLFDLIDQPDQTPDGPLSLSHVAGGVTLNNVCFSYTQDRPLIKDFNLAVQPGQRVAIVGPTGCGKTTIINLLMRFYDPVQGSIAVDGQDIKGVSRQSLRQSYGMILQDTWLKEGTIRENIVMGKPDATPAQVQAAAKAAHAHSFIRLLPKGYDTIIGEDGGSLSQGQKQLLCIARIMLCLPPMLILDEATSSIDTCTEVKIQDAFAHLMQGRTSFIVAHRLSTIRSADVILVMRDGNIVEQGTHQELLDKNGFYALLYNSQFTQ